MYFDARRAYLITISVVIIFITIFLIVSWNSCYTDYDCNEPKTCIKGKCDYECTVDSDCNNGVCSNSICVDCVVDSDCTETEYCEASTCNSCVYTVTFDSAGIYLNGLNVVDQPKLCVHEANANKIRMTGQFSYTSLNGSGQNMQAMGIGSYNISAFEIDVPITVTDASGTTQSVCRIKYGGQPANWVGVYNLPSTSCTITFV